MEKGCHWGAHRQGQPAVLAHPWQRVNTSPLSPYLRDQPVTTARLLVGPGPPQWRGVGVQLPASAAMVLRAEEHELSAHTGGRATPTGPRQSPTTLGRPGFRQPVKLKWDKTGGCQQQARHARLRYPSAHSPYPHVARPSPPPPGQGHPPPGCLGRRQARALGGSQTGSTCPRRPRHRRCAHGSPNPDGRRHHCSLTRQSHSCQRGKTEGLAGRQTNGTSPG